MNNGVHYKVTLGSKKGDIILVTQFSDLSGAQGIFLDPPITSKYLMLSIMCSWKTYQIENLKNSYSMIMYAAILNKYLFPIEK